MVLLFFQNTFLPTSMWRQIFCLGIGCFWSGTFFLRWLRQLFVFGAFQRWTSLASSRSTQCQHFFTLETPLPVGALGLNAFSHPWKFQVSYVFPPLALVPLALSKFLAEHINSQLRHLLLVASCWMEAPWLPTVLSMLADVPQQCPIIKKSHRGCFGRPGAQGSVISVFIPLSAQQCVLCRQGFSSSVCQAVVGAAQTSMSQFYQQCWKDWASWCV